MATDSDIKCSEFRKCNLSECIMWGQSQSTVNHSIIESITMQYYSSIFQQEFFYTNAREQ